MTATTEPWVSLVGLDELADARPVADDHVVGQDDRERLVADELLGHQHRVAQAQLLLLAHVADLDHVADLPHAPEHLDVALVLEQVLELVVVVEMVLDRPLLAAGDDDHLLDAGGDCLLDAVLDDRLVDQRQHLLGLRLGRGQESRPPAGGRKDCFSDAQSYLDEVLSGDAAPPGRHRPQGRPEYRRGLPPVTSPKGPQNASRMSRPGVPPMARAHVTRTN